MHFKTTNVRHCPHQKAEDSIPTVIDVIIAGEFILLFSCDDCHKTAKSKITTSEPSVDYFTYKLTEA